VQLRDIQEAFDQRTDTDSAKTLTQGETYR
jgi:hypothetical protein